MAQDPCAFNFIYTNYSDEKALFANFRHLQEHLNRIGCGLSNEDASYVFAANDSSDHDKRRADIVCDGVDDQEDIFDTILLMTQGGTIGFLPGHYIFSDDISNSPSGSGNHENNVWSNDLWLRGSPGVVFEWEAGGPASTNQFFFQGHIGTGALAVINVDGITFDGGGFNNIDAALWCGGNVSEQAFWRFTGCQFINFDGDYVIVGERIQMLEVTGCRFYGCAVDVSLFYTGGFSSGAVFAHDNLFSNCSGEFATGAGFGLGGLWTDNVFHANSVTFAVSDGPQLHRFVDGVHTAGDHTGITHDHGAHTGLSDDDHPQYLLHTVADTKGDIAAASAADVWDNLAAGSNQTVLVADSTQTLGLRYALPGGKDSIYGWYDVDLADALTADQMTRSVGVVSVPMAYPGSIVAVVVRSNEARTAGTATFEVFKNGVATGLTAVLDATNTQTKVTTQAFGTDTFVAGDLLDIRVTTSAWTPTTADVEAGLVVQYDS